MKDRILQIMKSKGMSQQEFSRATGIAPASLSSIFNERTAPTMKHAEALHRHFPELSLDWLLFGEGEMYPTKPVAASEVNLEGASGESGSDTSSSLEDANFHSPFGAGTGSSSEASNGFQAGVSSASPASAVASSRMPGATTGAAQSNYVRAREDFRGTTISPTNRERMSNYQNMQNYPENAAYYGGGDIVGFHDKKQRKIVEIRIFFDDGTFETFQGN